MSVTSSGRSSISNTMQITLGMVRSNRLSNVLKDHRLAGPRRSHDQSTLTFSNGRNDIDHPRRQILLCSIFNLEAETLVWIEWCEIIKVNFVPNFFRVFEINKIHLQQRKVALAFLRTSNKSLDGVTGSQPKTTNLRWRYIYIVWSREIIRVWRSKKTKPIRENLDYPLSDYLNVPRCQLFKYGEHQLLFPHYGSVFNLVLLGKC